MALGQGFLRILLFYLVRTIPSILVTHLHLHVFFFSYQSTKRRCSFGNGGTLDRKIFSLSIFDFEVSVEKRSFLVHVSSVLYSLIVAKTVNCGVYNVIFFVSNAMPCSHCYDLRMPTDVST